MKSYELETIVTVEATNIAQSDALPSRDMIAAWKEHVVAKINEGTSQIIGDENFTARVKVQVCIHEKENT